MARAAPAGPRSLSWLNGLLCGILAMLAPGLGVALALLLAPGLGALLLDPSEGRPVARAMLLFGLAASLPALRPLWEAGPGLDAATGAAAPLTLAAAWAAAGCGWLVAEVAPLAVDLVWEQRNAQRLAALRRRRREHEEEWGLPPAEETAIAPEGEESPPAQ